MAKNYYPRLGGPYGLQDTPFIEMTCMTCFGVHPRVIVLPNGQMVPPEEKPPCPACLGKGFHLISKEEYAILVEADLKRNAHTPRAQLLLNVVKDK